MFNVTSQQLVRLRLYNIYILRIYIRFDIFPIRDSDTDWLKHTHTPTDFHPALSALLLTEDGPTVHQPTLTAVITSSDNTV